MLFLALAYLGYCPLIPAATIAMCFTDNVVWSGVKFTVRDGRVSSMHRMDGKGDAPKGEWYTVSHVHAPTYFCVHGA